LLQRTVEDAVTGGIHEVRQQNGVLLGERLRAPRVKEKTGGDRYQQRSQGNGNLPPSLIPRRLRDYGGGGRRNGSRMQIAARRRRSRRRGRSRSGRRRGRGTRTLLHRRDASGTGGRHCPSGVGVPLKALQIGAHVGGMLVAQIPVLLQRLINDALQLGGQIR